MTPMREERVKKLRTFNKACREAGFKEVAPYVFERCGPFSKTLTLCTLIHGNEVGGIEVFIDLLNKIQSEKVILRSNLRFMLGNVEAYCEDKRYLETDMNRSFGLDEHRTKEELRAHELEKFLIDTDVLVDLHQTIGPTSTAFFIFEFEEQTYNLARYLHKKIPIVTYTQSRPFKGKTSTGYIIDKGGMGVTLETGQKGIEDVQLSLGLQIAIKAIINNFKIDLPSIPLTNTYTFSQIIINPDRDLELIKHFENFDPIVKGELLAKNSFKEVRSEVNGVILFPKYSAYAKTAPELALVLKKVNSIDDFS